MKKIIDLMCSDNEEDVIFAITILSTKGYSPKRIIDFMRNVRTNRNLSFTVLGMYDDKGHTIGIRVERSRSQVGTNPYLWGTWFRYIF